MTQFGSFLPEDQFATPQDIPFSEFSLAPEDTAMMNAGSYGMDPNAEPVPQQDQQPPVSVFPAAVRNIQGLMPSDQFDQMQSGMQQQPDDFAPSRDGFMDPNGTPDQFIDQRLDTTLGSNVDMLWDQATMQDVAREEEQANRDAIARGRPTQQELEAMSPRRSMTQLVQGIDNQEQMQGVLRSDILGMPLLGYRNDPEAERVLERRNFARMSRTGQPSPELDEYFNNQVYGGTGVGFAKQLAQRFSRGVANVLLLPQSLLVDMPAGTLSYLTDGKYGSDRLQDAANMARYMRTIGAGANDNTAAENFILDAVEVIPQLAAQFVAAVATGGTSGAGQLLAFAATGAGQAASSQWQESMLTNMEAGMSASAAAANANRDAATAFASTFVTEAIVGKVLKPFGVGVKLDEMSQSALRRAAGMTTAQTLLRGGSRGMFAEGIQEFADQAVTDLAVNMYRLDDPAFREFYKQNPNWVKDVFKNAAYAGLVGAFVGVPAGVITGISTRNGAAGVTGAIDQIVGRLPSDSPIARLLRREDLSLKETEKAMEWVADAHKKLAIDNTADNKQMRTLGAALDMDGIETNTLQEIIMRGNDGSTTAMLRGTSAGVGKFGRTSFVVTPAMAADELTRRELLSGRNAEGARTSLGAQAGMVNPATATETKEFVTEVEGDPADSMALNTTNVYDATGVKEESVKDFVRQNPALAARLARMEQPISRKMMEQMAGRAFSDNSVEFRADFKEQVKQQIAAQKDSPRRLQEGIDNQRRNAVAEIVAQLNGLRPEEVARVAAGVSPRKARVISSLMQQAEREAAQPLSDDATLAERVRRMENKEFVEAVKAREPGAAASASEVAQVGRGDVVAREAKQKEQRLREQFKKDLRDSMAAVNRTKYREMYVEARDRALADGATVEDRLDFLTAMELPGIADEFDVENNRAVVAERSLRYGDETDFGDLLKLAQNRAAEIVGDQESQDATLMEAAAILEETDRAATEDPNYVVGRSDAIGILLEEADDALKQDIANIIDSDSSLAVELGSAAGTQLAELPEPDAARTDPAASAAAENRVRGAIDNIRRTRSPASRKESRIPGMAEVRAERDAILFEEQQKVEGEMSALRKRKASLETERQPMLEDAWLTKPKGKKPAQRRKKRLPMTEAEQKIVTEIADIDAKMDALDADHARILEQRGIVAQTMPEPEAVDATSTFPNQDVSKKRRAIETARQQIAEANGLDLEEVKMRYSDGQTILTNREKRFVNFGKKLGITVVFIQTPKASRTAGAYKEGIVFLSAQDINRPSAMFAIALHETIHHIAKTSPETFVSLYKQLNRKMPRALRELRKTYMANLEGQNRMAAVRRAGLVMLNSENETDRDAILWVARNDESEDAVLLRANMPEQLMAALDSQDLSSLAEPTSDAASKYRKEFRRRMASAQRISLPEAKLMEEEVANLAEMLMDGAFVAVVDESGKIDVDELRRIADTKPAIGVLAKIASGIMDAFQAIPGVTKKARGMNDEQLRVLRRFADNPAELGNPRQRHAAQQLIARALVQMMDAKRGKIAMADIDANPMTAADVSARIPALDQSVREALAPLVSVEDQEELIRDQAKAAIKAKRPGIQESSISQAIRNVATFDNPQPLPLSPDTIQKFQRDPETFRDRRGATSAAMMTGADGQDYYVKHLVPIDPSKALDLIDKTNLDRRRLMLQNEMAANLIAEALGLPAFMPNNVAIQTSELNPDSDVGRSSTLVSGFATKIRPGLKFWAGNVTRPGGFDLLTISRQMGIANTLIANDLHSGNVDTEGVVFDYGGTMGIGGGGDNTFFNLNSPGQMVFDTDELYSKFLGQQFTSLDFIENPALLDPKGRTPSSKLLLQRGQEKQNLIGISSFALWDETAEFVTEVVDQARRGGFSSDKEVAEKIASIRFKMGSRLVRYLAPQYEGSGVLQYGVDDKGRPYGQSLAPILKKVASELEDFSDSTDANRALEASGYGTKMVAFPSQFAGVVQSQVAEMLQMRAVLAAKAFRLVADLLDGKAAFDEMQILTIARSPYTNPNDMFDTIAGQNLLRRARSAENEEPISQSIAPPAYESEYSEAVRKEADARRMFNYVPKAGDVIRVLSKDGRGAYVTIRAAGLTKEISDGFIVGALEERSRVAAANPTDQYPVEQIDAKIALLKELLLKNKSILSSMVVYRDPSNVGRASMRLGVDGTNVLYMSEYNNLDTVIHELTHALSISVIMSEDDAYRASSLGMGRNPLVYLEGNDYIDRLKTIMVMTKNDAVRDIIQIYLAVGPEFRPIAAASSGPAKNAMFGSRAALEFAQARPRWAEIINSTDYKNGSGNYRIATFEAAGIAYGLTNIDEFMAQATSSAEMRMYLARFPYDGDQAFTNIVLDTTPQAKREKSLLDRLYAAIKRLLLGMPVDPGNSALAKTSAAMSQIMETFSFQELMTLADRTEQESKRLGRAVDDLLGSRLDQSIRPIPAEVARTAGVQNIVKMARGKKFDKIRDFKMEIQRAVQAAAKTAGVDLTAEDSAAVDEYIVRVAMKDAKVALAMKNNAVGWYDEKVKKALAVMSLVYPELKADERSQFIMKMALAITSNQMDVPRNFVLAAQAYEYYKGTGRMPVNIGEGGSKKAMNDGMKRVNRMIAKHGIDWVMGFMQEKRTVRDIEKMTGKKVSGEGMNTVVYGAAIFGPKIGNGFFANLYGNYEQLTMDRWFMRTWGRWIGLLIDANPQNIADQRTQMRDMLKTMSQKSPSSLWRIGALINEDLTKFAGGKMASGRLTEIAQNIARRSVKEEFRDQLASMANGDNLRRMANTHARSVDGSIESPRSARVRNRIRMVMQGVLDGLRKDYPDLTMADLQAVYWYPEKRLYDVAKVDEDTDELTYDKGGLPDYEQAAIAFVSERNVKRAAINKEIKRIDDERALVSERRSTGGGRPAVGRGSTAGRRGQPAAPAIDARAARGADGTSPLVQSLRDSSSLYQPADAVAADMALSQAIGGSAVRSEVEDRLAALGRAWLGTARQIAGRFGPRPVSVEDSDDIEIVTAAADISPFWKFIAAPINLAIASKNPEVISVVEDMINMDMERNLVTKSRQDEATAVWESIPKEDRDSEEFSRYMDEYHPPDTIDTNPEFQSKSQAWRDALKWFKEREEVRREEIIETKRESIRGMLKRDNSTRLVARAAQNGMQWEVVRNDRGRKMIRTADGTVTMDQAREMLVNKMIPDDWGRQYAHFYHWFNGDFKLVGYDANGTRTIIGSAITEPEAYEKLYAFKRANPGMYRKLVAEPAVRIDPDDAVRLSDAQRRRLEKMLADATGAYRDEVADAMRGIVGSRTSKRPFYAPLMERTGAGGYVTDFPTVWNMSERLHNRWRMGGDMVRKLTPKIESIRRRTPGWGDYLAESMRHTLFTAPTMTEAAIDSMIRAIPVVGKIVSPFPTRRWLGSIRALNYARQLLTVRQQIVNSFQPLQTLYPILGEKGMMEAVSFYNSEEGKVVLRKHGFFDGSARFREGEDRVLGSDIMGFVSTMNDKIYKQTNETFNPSSEARNQNFAFVAMYHHAKYRMGMTEEEAVRYGRVYGNVYTQFYYTKANVPWLLRGPIASTSLQYRRFAINTTGLLVNEFQRGNYSGVARYMATMSLLGGIQSSIGLSAASLIRSLYLGDKEGADDLNYKLRQWLKSELGSESMADVAMMGLPAAIGIDLSGSISIWQKPFGRNVYEKIGATVAGPTVNTAIQLMTNLTAETAIPMGAGERLTRGLLDSSPAAQQVVNLWKLFSGDNAEYDAKGRLKFKLDPEEQFLKALAFRTVNETVWSMEYQRLRIIRNEVDRYANEAATYLAGNDRASAQKVLREFNSLYPMASMNMGDVERRAKNKLQSRQMPQLLRRLDIESGVVARRIADAEGLGE